VVEALAHQAGVHSAEQHGQLLHIVPLLGTTQSTNETYVACALVLNGFRSLFLMWENINSIGASLNWYGPRNIRGSFMCLYFSMIALLLWYGALSMTMTVFDLQSGS